MKNPFSYLFRARDKPQNAVSTAPSFYFGMSGSGKSVSPSSAIQVSAVYACVRVIAETIASLPFHVYEATDEGSRKAVEHPLYRLIHDEPNLEMTSFVWRETMLTHLLLYGNSYCQIIRTGRLQIDSLYPLLPDHMEVDRDSKGNLTYTYTTSDGKTWALDPSEVLHVPGLGFDGIVGYSPIALEKSAIGLGIAAEEYGSKFFSNGARPSGILTFDEVMDLFYSLRAPYRRSAVFLTNDATMKALRQLKNGNGDYIWQPSVTAGTPDTILNRPVYTSTFMPTIAAGGRLADSIKRPPLLVQCTVM